MKTKTFAVSALITLALMLVGAVLFSVNTAHGEATVGLPATQRMATTTVVGPGVKTIFASNPTCTARTISAVDGTGQSIRFLTADPVNGDLGSTTLSGVNGLFQAGSSTITYNSGLNGCGKWTAFATVSTTVTLVEYQ